MTAPNVLYYGDNLDILRHHIGAESVDLIHPVMMAALNDVVDRTPYYTAMMQASATMAALIGGFLLTFGISHSREVQTMLRRTEAHERRRTQLTLDNKEIRSNLEELKEYFATQVESFTERSLAINNEPVSDNEKSILFGALKAEIERVGSATVTRLKEGEEKATRTEQKAKDLNSESRDILAEMKDVTSPVQIIRLGVGSVAITLIAGMIFPMIILFIGLETVPISVQWFFLFIAVLSILVTIGIFIRIMYLNREYSAKLGQLLDAT